MILDILKYPDSFTTTLINPTIFWLEESQIEF